MIIARDYDGCITYMRRRIRMGRSWLTLWHPDIALAQRLSNDDAQSMAVWCQQAATGKVRFRYLLPGDYYAADE